MSNLNRNNSTNIYSVSQALDFYNFRRTEQKQSISEMMHITGAIRPDQSLTEYYSPKEDIEQLLVDIIDFVEKTQKHFVAREKHQERWETKHIDWSESEEKQIIKNVEKLDFFAEISPIFEDTDAICILGSVTNDMKIRLKYATKLLNKNILCSKYILLLAGERMVTPKIDGTKEELQNIAKRYDVELSKLTETHLLEDMYKHSAICERLPAFTINTPAGNLPRPTTETTLFELSKWLQNNKSIKRITFISDQPLIKYQTAIIRQVLKSMSHNIEFQVVGPKGSAKIKASSALSALGSYIWAQTPEILCHLGYKFADNKLKRRVRQLYQDNKFIFSNIKHLL